MSLCDFLIFSLPMYLIPLSFFSEFSPVGKNVTLNNNKNLFQIPNRYKNPKKHPTKKEKNTRHHDVTFNFLIFFQLKLNSSTPHSKTTSCQGVGLVMQACWVGVGDAQIFQVPISMAICFSFRKKMVQLCPVGGFNDFLCSSLFGEDEPILTI